MEDEKYGHTGARKFIESAVEGWKIGEEIEKTGKENLQEQLPKVVELARKLGYNFEVTDLEAVLREDWGEDEPYLAYFCFSEPPLL